MDPISPMEKFLLNSYLLETKDRKIIPPKNNLPASKALAEVDQNSLVGNNDGETTLNEWRNYLSWIARYNTQNYWNQDNFLVEKVLPQLREKLQELGEVVGIKVSHPFDDPQQKVEKYTKSNLILLYLLDNPEADPELAKEIKKTGLRAVEQKKQPQLFQKLQDSYNKFQKNISDKKKWEYLNKLLNHNAFLNVSYTSDKTDHSRQKIGQMLTPVEILDKKGTVKINCLEISSLTMVMARAIDLPASLYEVKLAVNSTQKADTITPAEIVHHMVVELIIDEKKFIFDPAIFQTGRETIKTLEKADYQELYKNYSLSTQTHDLLSELSAFYLFSATLQINTLEQLLYNDNLVELSYLVDPIKIPVEYNYYTLVNNYYSKCLHASLTRSDLFHSLAENHDDPHHLIKRYLEQFKFNLKAVETMESISLISDNKYSSFVLEQLATLKPSNYLGKTFYYLPK